MDRALSYTKSTVGRGSSHSGRGRGSGSRRRGGTSDDGSIRRIYDDPQRYPATSHSLTHSRIPGSNPSSLAQRPPRGRYEPNKGKGMQHRYARGQSKQSSFTALNRRFHASESSDDEDGPNPGLSFTVRGKAVTSTKSSSRGRYKISYKAPVRTQVESGHREVSHSKSSHRSHLPSRRRTGVIINGKIQPLSDDADDEDEDDEIVFLGHSKSSQPPQPLITSKTKAARKTALHVEATEPAILDIKDTMPELARALSRLDLKRSVLQHKIPTESDPPSLPVGVRYRYRGEAGSSPSTTDSDSDGISDMQELRSTMDAWCCPLCDVLGEMGTRAMLKAHLSRDHPKVQVIWEQDGVSQFSWILTLILSSTSSSSSSSGILEVTSEEGLSQHENEADQSVNPQQPAPVDTPSSDTFILEGHIKADEIAQELITTVKQEIMAANVPLEPQSVTQDPRPSSPPVKIQHKFLNRSPSPVGLATAGFLRSLRPAPAHPSSYRGSLPSQYPDPPPPSDPLGPAAQYPYLPDDGDQYSCRPGGPRLFDLLNTLPLEPFGVLSWMIVDREEEMYELDDMRDEDKVILALWNRWIFLNRRKFIFEGHAMGAAAFVDEYWEMIHRAAGWGALRAFLLMLMINKYLTDKDVARLLKQYEAKTGMDLWYKDLA
ncbi:hypothetical protein BXZ70DRAFT_65019 [Cristinia sonorae]|uniref:Uncharacterized protein n=1 Tax=Cristinia sonorae TaxID=1940300 RepID=A0A8K0UR95_9AGAR|nr:hypothetical protein BXZ70DRAFT_65019 [Cristinia sonorae]